jgi:hypothetical protein
MYWIEDEEAISLSSLVFLDYLATFGYFLIGFEAEALAGVFLTGAFLTGTFLVEALFYGI